MQNYSGILQWDEHQRFEAAVTRCGHMRLHTMQRDEKMQDAEMFFYSHYWWVFENVDFTNATYKELCTTHSM